MFLELNDSIREEVISLLFHMPVEVGPADEDGGGRPAAAAAGRRTAAGRTGTSPTSTSRSPAPTRSRPPVRAPAPSAAALGGDGARAGAADRRQVRPREHRPQRPVLVRLGQEVQALPRRVTAPERLVGTSICLDPITSDDAGDLDWLAREDDVRRFTRVPSDAASGVRRRVGGALRARLGGRQPGRASRSAPSTAQFLGLAGFVAARPRRRARASSATSSRAEARGRGVATAGGRAADALGLRRARARADHAADRRRERGVRDASPSAAATRARASCGRRT